MPVVVKAVEGVTVEYRLVCGLERATALMDDLNLQLRDEKGYDYARDTTNGFDYHMIIAVTYDSLADACRLDQKVRQLLSRKVAYTYTDHSYTSCSKQGGVLAVRSYTTIQEAA